MSVTLAEISITGTPFNVDTQHITINQLSYVEFLNESPYTLQVQMQGLQFNIPAWYDYPIAVQARNGPVWQPVKGAALPIVVSPMLLPAAGNNLSSALLVTLWLCGETPAIVNPQPLVRQAFVPNPLNANVVSNTLSNETNGIQVLVIDIGQVGHTMLIVINSDGSFTWSVLQAGTAHQVLKAQTAGNPLQIGQAGDISEILGRLNVDQDLFFDGNLGVNTAGDVINASGLDTYVSSRGGGNVLHLRNAATDTVTIDSNGLHLQRGSIFFIKGGIFGIAHGSSTTVATPATVVIGHGLGATPIYANASVNVANGTSQPLGITWDNNNVQIACTTAGLPFTWFAVVGS